MTSLLGCSGEDFSSVLRALGYRMERRPAPPPTAAAASSVDGDGTPATESLAAVVGDEPSQPGQAEELPADEAGPTVTAEGSDQSQDGDGARIEAGADKPPEFDAPAESGASEETAEASEETAEAEELSQPADNAPSDGDPDAQPAFIEIWRPGRRDRPRQNRDRPPAKGRPARHRHATIEAAAPGEPADNRKARPKEPRKRKFDGQRNRQSPRGAPAEKRADPNSPFAALAALKAQLEGKDEGH